MLLSLVLSLLPSFCLCLSLSLSLCLSLSLSLRDTHTCMHRYTCKHTEMHTENCDTEMHTQNCHTEMHTLRIATQMRTHRIANIKLVLIWVDGAVLQVMAWIVAEIFHTFVHLIMIQVTGLSVLFGTTLSYNYGNIFLKCSHGIFLFFDKVKPGFPFCDRWFSQTENWTDSWNCWRTHRSSSFCNCAVFSVEGFMQRLQAGSLCRCCRFVILLVTHWFKCLNGGNT